MTLQERFAANLKRIRREADLSQEAVAALASIHRTEISFLERGMRIPRIDTLMKLCAVLEVRPDELLEGIEWRPGRAVEGAFCTAGDDGG